jgi:hypothetical protein
MRRIVLLVAVVSLLGGCSADAPAATAVQTAPPPMVGQLAPLPPVPVVVLALPAGGDPAGFDALLVALRAVPGVTVLTDAGSRDPDVPDPDVVVVGIGGAPVVGPLVARSPLVSAAAAAAHRDLPSIAVSAGGTSSSDFAVAARLAAEEIDAHRAEYGSGTNLEQVVVNLNSPSCTPGTMVRGVVDVPVASESPADSGVPAFDCASTMIEYTDDASALAVGFASRSIVALAG